jgi:hypothetical protein
MSINYVNLIYINQYGYQEIDVLISLFQLIKKDKSSGDGL